MIEFALQRKTGYIREYSLAGVYPSHRKNLRIQGPKGEHVAPMLVKIPLVSQRWFRIHPALVRFPSWVSRKVRNLDREGFVKRKLN